MNSYKTKNGVDVWITRTYDCEPNLGGFYCQIYLDKDLERELDDFVIPAEVVNDNKEEEFILEFISDYWADVTNELCPHCGKDVELIAEMKAQKCPECGRWIAPCSLCEECKKNCVVEFDCVRLNRNTLTSRELTNEQWQLLADLVLAEMTHLRELSNGRSDEVKNALKVDIGKLHTLYNFLID